ncbi:MAG: WecB/TagA/CpsF family glycosyltransferase [Alphaproteobacteria bacterium]|nr:WecB/TagA/CpsF family glycosyltransferase [Alphaproteobacteria bacterium]
MTLKRFFLAALPLDVVADSAAICALLQGRVFPQSVAFAAPRAWELAQKDPSYAGMLGQMSLVIADGRGVSVAARLACGEACAPIGFESVGFFNAFFETIANNNLTVGLVGGPPGNDEEVQNKLVTAYPGLKIVTTMHGYGDSAAKIEKLMLAAPDVILVGMESPRQESFLLALRAAGYKGFAIATGDFFSHYPNGWAQAGCPAWMRRYHVDFLYRLCREPKRLWRRYLVEYPLFYIRVLQSLAQKARAAARA